MALTFLAFLVAPALASGLSAQNAGQEQDSRDERPVHGAAPTGTPALVPVDPLLPDTILTPPERPRIVVLRAPGSPVITLRLFVPVSEAPSEAGAARLLQVLGTNRARGVAGTTGAQVEGARTPWGIVYSVRGAVDDLDYLAYLLRIAVAEPVLDRVDVQRGRNRLLDEARVAEETPAGRIAESLRSQAAPEVTPLGGTTASLAGLSRATLREVWSRTHRAPDLTLLAVGDLPHELLLTSVQGMGAPPGPTPEPPSAPAPTVRPNRVQVLRSWYGQAHVIADARDPRADVAALLVAQRFREEPGPFEARVELWDLDGRKALAAVGAAYSRSASAMRTRVSGIVGETAEAVEDEEIREAVARVRAEALFAARTPHGRASLVGRFLDATGDPGAARRYVDGLEALTPEAVRSFLREIADGRVVRAEVRP